MNKAYKFRLYPTKEQQQYFEKCFGCSRFIYNKMLEDKLNIMENSLSTKPKTYSQWKLEFDWLYEVDSLALANASLNLQTAFKNYFKRCKTSGYRRYTDKQIKRAKEQGRTLTLQDSQGFPKFKSKHNTYQSYTTNNQGGNIRIQDNKIKLPKIGFIKLKQHREIPENWILKSCTISKNSCGDFYISILFYYDFNSSSLTLDANKSLGLDYNSQSFYTDSQRVDANYPKFYRTSQNFLAKEQRRLSKMVKNSSNYKKQKMKIAKISEHISNQRKDWVHKLSTNLANQYDIICVEDIDLKALSQCLNLGKSTNDNGFGMFRTLLDYKLTERGKKLVKINRWFPSSKMCHFCGTINTDLKLSDKEWTCCCGEHLQRDHNAAINILNEGLRILNL